jgi:hypothetical protein
MMQTGMSWRIVVVKTRTTDLLDCAHFLTGAGLEAGPGAGYLF